MSVTLPMPWVMLLLRTAAGCTSIGLQRVNDDMSEQSVISLEGSRGEAASHHHHQLTSATDAPGGGVA